MREGDGDVVPGVELKEASVLTERGGARALGLGIRHGVHAEELHVVGGAQEVGAADLHQAAPRVGGLQVHPEGEGEDRSRARGEDRGREARVVLVGRVGVEHALADPAQRWVGDVRDVGRIREAQLHKVRLRRQREKARALENRRQIPIVAGAGRRPGGRVSIVRTRERRGDALRTVPVHRAHVGSPIGARVSSGARRDGAVDAQAASRAGVALPSGEGVGRVGVAAEAVVADAAGGRKVGAGGAAAL